MADVPVKALVTFHRALNGVNIVQYNAGEVYPFPAHLATGFARQGKVEILTPAVDKPKRKRKKKEKDNVEG